MITRLHSLFMALALLAGVHQAAAQGTAFTYQGRLNSDGVPASGTYNLTFTLFNNTNAFALPIAGPVTNNSILVTSGLFTVTIDFGSSVWNGATNWLQIGVETNGVNSFTTLVPPQQLTPVPYAIFAKSASNLLGALPASQLTTVSGGFGNFFVGMSGNPTTSGPYNTAIGYSALIANGNGSYNTAYGAQALQSNTGGLDNTANGAETLSYNTSGSYNTANGAQALQSNTTGSYNTANGYGALLVSTTGSYNTVDGWQALFNNLSGSYNTADGVNTLYNNRSGNNNTAMGVNALQYLGYNGFGGTNNIALGYQAGYYFSGNESGNIDIGNQGFAGDNNTIRIGDPNVQTNTFIAGVINGNGGGLTNLNISAAQFSGTNGSPVMFNNGANSFDGSFYGAFYGSSFIGGYFVGDFIGSGSELTGVWVTGGNSGTTPGVNYVGTSDNEPLEMHVNGQRALRLEPGVSGEGAPNVIGGSSVNFVSSGVGGATIGGGGATSYFSGASFNPASPNSVTANFGTVGGGAQNTASGTYATIPGGAGNLATGAFSFAAGDEAQATNNGAFVWADSQNAPFASTTTNQFNIRAGGGVRFVTGGTGMTVDGQPLLAGTVGASQIDDGGAAAYQVFQQTVQSVGGDSSIPFADVLPVKATNGVTPSFTLTVNGSAFGSVVGFSGDEGISQPYAYVVEVLSSGAAVNPDAQLGLNGQLTYTRNGRSTSFGGLVTACTLAASNGASLLYTFRLESPLATMSLSTDYQIYQNKTAPLVAATVYLNATANTAAQSLTASYTAHDNLIQFGETDLNFFSRILEYEGIFYFFNQGANPPSLVMGDSLSAYLASPNSPFSYYGNLTTNVPSGAEYIQTFQKAYHQSTLASTVSAYNFTTPTTLQSATASGTEGVGSLFEFGSSSVQTTVYNQLIAQVRQDRQTAARSATAGSGTAPDLHAGYTFALNDQTGAGLGNTYLVTSIHHAGFVRVTNGVSTVFYGNQFQAIPASLNYRPPLATPKPQAQPCIAVVTGPSGQEIYVDQYGRVKVQFKWDRYGANNDTSSAWIRMTSPMAGANGRGMMFLPRIGDEVLVSFVEGDPDQPVITGSLYNANNTPPYTLPSSETVSTIRSTGTPAQPSQINEIKFDDKAASQILTIQAAKDLSVIAANNTTLSAGNSLSVTATGSATLAAGTSLNISATGNATLSSGGGLSIQAGTQTTFTGPVSLGSLTATSVSAGSQSVTGGMNIDQANLNSGTVSANALTFGNGSGEGIGSQRTSGANQYDLVFYTANAARMSILNNGYVGIGTSLPTAPLNVQGNQTGSFGNATVLIANTNGTSSSGPALRVQSNGTGQYGVLSVSANNLTGPIAEFGNANTWVATIANDGTISATAFNSTSDRNAKANFAPVNPATVLAKVAALPISEWNFKTNPADQKHLGPMAQDFHAAFGLNGADDKHISVVDEGGVALAAIQGLNLKVEEQQAELQQKETEVTELKQRLAALEKIVFNQKSN